MPETFQSVISLGVSGFLSAAGVAQRAVQALQSELSGLNRVGSMGSMTDGMSRASDRIRSTSKTLSQAVSGGVSEVSHNADQMGSSFSKASDRAQNGLSGMLAPLKSVASAMGIAFGIGAFMNFTRESIEAASNAEEIQNKFDVVFQGMTDSVTSWADTYADAIGRSRTMIKGYLADNQNMFVGMGMTRKAGAELSEQMVSLGLDLASFNNISENDAVNALSKALMGETESAKSLGAVLNDNTIAAAMNTMGISDNFNALSEAEKMQVRC